MNNAQPSGMDLMLRLDSLLSTEQNSILSRERENINHIHLYNLGGYWAAFDKSAFQIEQVANVSEVPEIFELHNNPFPLVMHILDEKDILLVCKKKYPEFKNRKHIQLPCTSINSTAYNSWYKETVY